MLSDVNQDLALLMCSVISNYPVHPCSLPRAGIFYQADDKVVQGLLLFSLLITHAMLNKSDP